MATLSGRTQNINNEVFLWKIAVLGMEKPSVGVGTSCPSPMVFYIPPCRKTFPAWRNEKCPLGRETNVPALTGGFSIPRTAIFQKRASF
jgi:hypothetical protein